MVAKQLPEGLVNESQTAQAPWAVDQAEGGLFSQAGWWDREAEEDGPSGALQGPPGAAQASESPPEPEVPTWEIPEADRRFFEEVLDLEPKDLENQMTGWYQAQEGNCATVAVAKAATDILGVQDERGRFRLVPQRGSRRLRVTLRIKAECQRAEP